MGFFQSIWQNIQSRLTVSHMLVALLSLILISIFSGQVFIKSSFENEEHRLEDVGFAVSNALEDPLSSYLEEEDGLEIAKQILDNWMTGSNITYFALYLPDGKPITTTFPANTLPVELIWSALSSDLGESGANITTPSGKLLTVAIRVEHEDEIFGVLVLSVDDQHVWANAWRDIRTMFLYTIVSLVSMGAVGWILARTLTKPLANLRNFARSLSTGNLSNRIEAQGPTEIVEVADAMNQMAASLDENVTQMRAFVANASHELRTPLTSIKLRLEALQQGMEDDPALAQQFLQDIEGETDRLSTMVNDLLELSRIESGMVEITKVDFALAALVENVIDSVQMQVQNKGVEIELVDESNRARVMIDPDQIFRVIFNYLDNALKHTKQNDMVQVRIVSMGSTIRLEVTDHGVGIMPEHISHLFERFYRVDGTKPRANRHPGSGLGLAIAKSIVEAHGGKVGVRSEPLKETVFWFEIPQI